MSIISFEDFKKLDLRVGTIRVAERAPNSEKLLRLEVDFGLAEPRSCAEHDATQTNAERNLKQIIAGIGRVYAPETLVGTQCVFITNLEPRILMSLESQGMLLAASDAEGNPVLLHPEKEIPPGSLVH